MAFSQVDICNNALVKVGSERIVSISDEVKQAQTLAAIWDMKRESELAAYPWKFAMTRASLPALVTAPAFGFGFAYQLPSDYLRMVEVGEHWVLYSPTESGDMFSIEGSQILCDEASPLNIRYIRSVTNPGEFTALFAEVFACRLALELSNALTESIPTKRDLKEDYRVALTAARRSSAFERAPQRHPEDTWSLAMRDMAG